MSKMTAIRKVSLTERYLNPGRTTHSVNGQPSPLFISLVICWSPKDASCFLMRICENEQVADTWHANLNDAIHQAEWEFGVQPEEWTQNRRNFLILNNRSVVW